MNFHRRKFVQILTGGFAGAWVKPEQAWGKCSEPKTAAEILGLPPLPTLDPRLRQWLEQPRLPLLKSGDPVIHTFIRASLLNESLKFTYDGGSTPGTRRRIAPALVFHHPDSDVVYASGWCHLRQAERTFRLDRVRPGSLKACGTAGTPDS